ncbi:MAG: GNAT family N-acetyltransferase [Candidatus Shapirobacteria bacterium]|jgi:RimJ/RimL family protein N-acetyltransferase
MEIDKDVFVQQGILDCQIDQLIEYSNTDIEIKKNTTDSTRFKNRDMFNQWLKKGRIIYSLIDKNKNLLGIIWFGQKDPPIKLKANFTFAIRIYGPARGQGLSQIFLKTTFDDLLKNQSKSQITGFWLETFSTNLAAIHTYEKFGFKKVDQIDDRDIMVL